MKRWLAAILAADIAGYSRLMVEDEAATVRDLKGHQAVILPLVGRHDGRIIDTAGDGILAEFPSVIEAAECAVEIQTIMAARNADVPEHRRMLFRIGINLGEAAGESLSESVGRRRPERYATTSRVLLIFPSCVGSTIKQDSALRPSKTPAMVSGWEANQTETQETVTQAVRAPSGTRT
jgi:hypothetical protein